MKADNTRCTFNKASHYSSVRMQQGRVQLDSDSNEQADIAAHRVETETIDVIGSCGGPMDGAGFALTPLANDLQITAGRYYVDGILCENDAVVPASAQPDLPPNAPIVKLSPTSTVTFPPADGQYVAYLDVWSRHITALDDPLIREVALGGPDTATRAKTIWQVKFLKVASSIRCLDSVTEWHNLTSAPDGQLAARTSPNNPDPNPCIVAPGAGYRSLENQIYRVEIHKSGATGAATFKWSRDNGSIVTSWLDKTNDELTVGSIGRDKVLNFASGQWVELSDDARDLMGQPGTLVQLVKAEGNVLTIDPATAIPSGSVNFPGLPLNPKVRRWNSDGEMNVTVPVTNDGWIALEDGVQIKFKPSAQYRSGDYWLIPARTATADVEWPKDAAEAPLPMPPKGIEHHYCRLAVVRLQGGSWRVLDDCRCLFPSLTQVNSLNYVSGDGQEAMPDLTVPAKLVSLPQPLVVGVVNPHCRGQRARVRFTVLIGDGKVIEHGGGVPVDTTIDVLTDDDGLASCDWSLDGNPSHWSQQVEATLLDSRDNPIHLPGDNPTHLPIRFNANLSIADRVAYHPKQCSTLANQKTVQQAIDRVAAVASLYPASETNFSLLPNRGSLFLLRVVASSKCGPVSGMQVTFKVIPPGSGLVNPATAPTDGNGFASCSWTPAAAPGTQVVEAELQANADHPTVPPTIVRFTAQQAVVDDPGFHVTGLSLDAATWSPSPPSLRNDMTVRTSQFRNGLQIECDAKVDRISIENKPVCFVTLEIPFFEGGAAGGTRTMVGFQPVILDGSVKFGTTIGPGGEVTFDDDPQKIVWTPTREAVDWIERLLASLKDTKVVRLLARLTVMGSFIWEEGNPNIYLDGEVFGLSPGPPFDLRLPESGDGKRGGDLEMWFWVKPTTIMQGPVLSIDKTLLDFGTVTSGGFGEQVFTIRNIGDAPFELKSINSNNSAFASSVGPLQSFLLDTVGVSARAAALSLSAGEPLRPSQSLPVTIGPNQGVTVTVQMSCIGPAEHRGQLTIETDPSVSGGVVTLQGTCRKVEEVASGSCKTNKTEIILIPSPGAVFTTSPPNVATGTASITNDGFVPQPPEAPFTLTSVTITPPVDVSGRVISVSEPLPFSIVAPQPVNVVLNNGQFKEVTVRYERRANVIGDEHALLIFNINKPFGCPAIKLIGRGGIIAGPALEAPTEVDFGSQNRASETGRDFVLRNAGTAKLEAKVSTGQPQLKVSPEQVTIEPGASQTLRVSFAGTAIPGNEKAGAKTAAISIRSNDPTTPNAAVRVNWILTEPLKNPILDLSVREIELGNVTQATTAQNTIVILNKGNAPLQAKVSTGQPQLKVSPEQVTIDAGGSQTLNLSLVGSAISASEIAGAKTAAINIASNDPSAPNVSVPVKWNLTIEPVKSPILDLSVKEIDLGNVTRTTTLDKTIIRIGNTGNAPMDVRVSAGHPALTVSLEQMTIDAGGSQRLAVRFVGAAIPATEKAGAKSAAINIASNDPIKPSVSVPVRWNLMSEPVKTPALTLSATEIDLGNVTRATTLDKTIIKIGNTGNAPLDVKMSTDRPQFTVSLEQVTIDAGGSQKLVVRFVGTAIPPREEVGAKTGAIKITSNDPGKPTVLVPVRWNFTNEPGMDAVKVDVGKLVKNPVKGSTRKQPLSAKEKPGAKHKRRKPKQ